MREFARQVTALGDRLERSIESILQAAGAIEEAGGTSSDWNAILIRYDVEATGAADKSAEVARLRMHRGAIVDEVYRVLENIGTGLRTELLEIVRRIPQDVGDDPADSIAESPALETQIADLEERLDGLPGEMIQEYKSRVCAPRSMFGHIERRVRSRMEKEPVHQRSGFTLKCNFCGAPRINESDYICGFCGGPLGA